MKKLLTVLLILALLPGLCACAVTNTPEAAPTAAQAPESEAAASEATEVRTPFLETELQYRGVSIGDTVERMRELLGEPEEITAHRNTDPEPPQGLEHRVYRYADACFREAYTETEGWSGVIGQIEIWNTGFASGPRGICIGDGLEAVLSLFPREYDYKTDEFHRFYGLPWFEGAGGAAYPGLDGTIDSVSLTTDEMQPYLRMDFQDGKVIRLFLGYSWI